MTRRNLTADSSAASRSARRSPEAGTVLLLVVFMAAAMLIAAMATLPRAIIQGRRQKEQELVWRGNQYVRAIRLYYRKYGHFPRTIEDFSKNPGNIHFLRKEYKDPINTADGTWRYIYVGPGGQLIGSITHKLPLGLIPLGQGAPGTAPGTNPSGSLFGGPVTAGGTGAGLAGQSGSQGVIPGQPVPPDSGTPNPDDPTQPPLPPAPVAPNQATQGLSTADSTVFGGQLVGVASKVDRKSILFYKGYGKYREWEFIWDPSEDTGGPGGLSAVPIGGQLPTIPQTGTQPLGTQPIGTQPIGTSPNNPQ
ncbi:MAG TPA: hypothetical protein VMV61_08930 [Patescibacteria group bacterium]|nr:hypothetical protein [Patescibacteria group bacterium]